MTVAAEAGLVGDEEDGARVCGEVVGKRSRVVVMVWSAVSDRPETDSESSATEK